MVEDLDSGGGFWCAVRDCLRLGPGLWEDSFIGHMIDGKNVDGLVLERRIANNIDAMR